MSHNSKKGVFEVFNASDLRVGIVAAQFNQDISSELLFSAKEMLFKYGVKEKNIIIEKVPGSVEVPVVLQTLALSKKFDCLVALGVIIRGDTPHFDYVAKIVSEGVLRVMLDYNIPIGFSVLTCDTKKQAEVRLSSGGEAVQAALQSFLCSKKYKIKKKS